MNYKHLGTLIDEKLIDIAIRNNKSVTNIDRVYKNFIEDITTIYRNPKEYKSQIMVLAYHKTRDLYKVR